MPLIELSDSVTSTHLSKLTHYLDALISLAFLKCAYLTTGIRQVGWSIVPALLHEVAKQASYEAKELPHTFLVQGRTPSTDM